MFLMIHACSLLNSGLQISVGGMRAILRAGAEGTIPTGGPQKGVLIAVPLFHVIGTSLTVSEAPSLWL